MHLRSISIYWEEYTHTFHILNELFKKIVFFLRSARGREKKRSEIHRFPLSKGANAIRIIYIREWRRLMHTNIDSVPSRFFVVLFREFANETACILFIKHKIHQLSSANRSQYANLLSNRWMLFCQVMFVCRWWSLLDPKRLHHTRSTNKSHLVPTNWLRIFPSQIARNWVLAM